MIEALGAVFDCLGTLALRLDTLGQGLPEDEPLRATLSNLIRSRLSAVLRQLIGFYLAGDALGVVDRAAPPSADLLILGRGIVPFDSLLTGPGLSADWPQGVGLTGWGPYIVVDLTEPTGAYGTGPADVDKINHLAANNLFTAACEAFLAGYARIVDDAGSALQASFAQASTRPALRAVPGLPAACSTTRASEVNTLPGKHLDFYYRQVLRLTERPARPSQAHVLVELAKHIDRPPAPRRAPCSRRAATCSSPPTATWWPTRPWWPICETCTGTQLLRQRRPCRSPTAGSSPTPAAAASGQSGSWHPFAAKTYADGSLASIDMPPAEIGFAVASHHLWLAEGTRTIQLQIGPAAPTSKESESREPGYLRARLSTAKGWLEQDVDWVDTGGGGIGISLTLDPNDPPITPYDPAVHGYAFDTALPVLVVTLRHPDDAPWSYPLLAGTRVSSLTLTTWVNRIRTLALANDQGPIDPAKPFLAFGSAPTSNSSLVIGCKEAFQKAPVRTWLAGLLMATPVAHTDTTHPNAPALSFDYLDGGSWHPLRAEQPVYLTAVSFPAFDQPAVITPDLTPNAAFSTTSRGGFIRIKLDQGYGTDRYPVALAAWVAGAARAIRRSRRYSPSSAG